MKKYYPVKENERGITHICVYLDYSLGGAYMLDYTTKPRGYYLKADPVKRERGFVAYGLYTGRSQLIKEVKRKSKSAELAAIKDAELVQKAFIGRVLASNHLELA